MTNRRFAFVTGPGSGSRVSGPVPLLRRADRFRWTRPDTEQGHAA